MTRIHVICEGQTEEAFVNELLLEAFARRGVYLIASLLGRPGHKGGNVGFERLLTDVKGRLWGDTGAFCTTFFDFYGLSEDFPGKRSAQSLTMIDTKADCLLAALKQELQKHIGETSLRRFIPYVQMYEFEGLLFSDPQTLATCLGQASLGAHLQKIREAFASPEDINNSPDTAPAKRLQKLYPPYRKTLDGPIAAKKIGLRTIRRECRRFDAWLQRLETL